MKTFRKCLVRLYQLLMGQRREKPALWHGWVANWVPDQGQSSITITMTKLEDTSGNGNHGTISPAL